jgi:hypothetical protein
MIQRGLAIGAATAAAVEHILNSRPHPELGYRSCLGVFRLADRYSPQRLEAACRRAVALQACSYRSIKSILKTGLDHQPLEPVVSPEIHSQMHANVRGADYYRPEVL